MRVFAAVVWVIALLTVIVLAVDHWTVAVPTVVALLIAGWAGRKVLG